MLIYTCMARCNVSQECWSQFISPESKLKIQKWNNCRNFVLPIIPIFEKYNYSPIVYNQV